MSPVLASAQRPPAPRISVVVPAYNEAKLIDSCLQSIAGAFAANGVGPAEREIIVVDNASSDDTAARAAALGALVVHEPVRQIARARNRGGRAARGRWLLFVDADSWPDADLISDLLRVMDDPQVVGGGSVVQMPHLPLLMRSGVWVWNRCSRWLGWACGAFIFCRRDAFEAVNGFDERLFVSEEVSFSRRLKRYARWRGQRMVILSRHPLNTSARKAELYTQGEMIALGFRMLRHPRRFFRDPTLCAYWYEGRR